MLIYANFMLSYESKVFLQLFGDFSEHFPDIAVAGALDVFTYVYYQFYMPSALLHVIFESRGAFAAYPTLFVQLYVFFNVIELPVDSLNLLLPLTGVNFALYDLVIDLLFIFSLLIVIVSASVRIEKVDLGLLGSSMLHPILLRN